MDMSIKYDDMGIFAFLEVKGINFIFNMYFKAQGPNATIMEADIELFILLQTSLTS